MKRFHSIPLSLLAALCLATATYADIVILKSGEKFEGRIHNETPDSIEIEYHLTPKIKDNKTILKSDIKDIKKQTEAEVEYQERDLEHVMPTADLMSASDYERIIQDKLGTFVAKYPGTPEAAKVEKMIKDMDEEKSKVLSGQVKMEGKWLDSARVKRESYNIEAYRQTMFIKSREAEANDMHYLNALRAFDTLRTEYGASPYFALQIPTALDLLKKYETQLNTMITEAPILIKKREEGLRATNGQENQDAKRTIEAENKAFKAKLDLQTKNKVKWKDISKYDVKSLQDALSTVAKERTELQALDLTALAQENRQIMAIIRYLADGNAAEARAVYDQLARQQNLINKSMLPGLLRQIETAAKAAAAAERKEKAQVVVEPAPSTAPKDKEEKSGVNPAAAELKRIQEEKAKKGTGAATNSDKKAAGAPADGKTPAKTSTPIPVAAAPAEESGGISDYIPYIGGGLVIVLLLAWFIGKRKKEKDA